MAQASRLYTYSDEKIPTAAAASIPQDDEAGPIGPDTYLDGERQTHGCNGQSRVRAACGNAT
jgi:hypothetical protein